MLQERTAVYQNLEVLTACRAAHRMNGIVYRRWKFLTTAATARLSSGLQWKASKRAEIDWAVKQKEG